MAPAACVSNTGDLGLGINLEPVAGVTPMLPQITSEERETRQHTTTQVAGFGDWREFSPHVAWHVIVWLLLLAGLIYSIYALSKAFICDNQKCTIFTNAAAVAEPDTQAYILNLLDNLYVVNMWPFVYLASFIVSLLALWFLRSDNALHRFLPTFIITGLLVSLMFIFCINMYIRPVAQYVAAYVPNHCIAP